MGNPVSYFYYSDNETVESWTQKRYIELRVTDSINSRCRQLELIVIDPKNTEVDNFFEYQRIKIVEKYTGDDNLLFLGRIEQIIPDFTDNYGQIVKLVARDYAQELTERPMDSNLSTPKIRSAHISDIISDYTYSGNITTNIETSGSDVTMTRDVSGSQISPLGMIEQLASEDPWTNTTWDSPDGAVWRWDNSGTTWVDNTVEADSAAGTPFSMIGGDTDDYRYFGRNNPFVGLTFDNSVQGNYGDQTWQYWNGSSWTSLTLTKEYDFTSDGDIMWDAPTDWAAKAFSNGDPHGAAPPNATSRYWVRCSVASISTDATILSVTIIAGNGYDYYVDNSQVFQYFRRGSKPSGGAESNGLTIEFSGTESDQVHPMFADYSFYEIPQELITRVTVRGSDEDGNNVSATSSNSDLETQLKIIKEHQEFIYGATTEVDCQIRADSLLGQRGNSVIKRGSVKVIKYPFFYKSGSYNIVRSGDLVRIKCSPQSIDEDMLILEIVYKEPIGITEISLLSNAWGRGFASVNLSSAIKTLREGLSIGMARIGDLVVGTAKIGDLAVTNAKIGSCSIDKLTAGSLSVAGTITAGGKLTTASSGTRIEINNTEIAGYNGATKQFYLSATDGKAYCGGGSVILDSSGIHCDNGLLTFRFSGTDYWIFSGSPGSLSIGQLVGGQVLTLSAYQIILALSGGLFGPIANNSYVCGDPSHKWLAVYSTNYYGCPLPTVTSGISTIKKIKNPKILKKMDIGDVEGLHFKDTDMPDECKEINSDGNKSIEMFHLLGVNTQAIRELVDKIESIEEKVGILENK